MNNRRNIIHVTSRILLAITLLLAIISISYKVYTNNIHKEPYKVSDEVHIVQNNETLWGIAETIEAHKDIREVVADIRDINGISPLIHEGQQIRLPEY